MEGSDSSAFVKEIPRLVGLARNDNRHGVPENIIVRSLRIFWSLIEDDLRVTLAAQIFTIPLILFHFHRISIISPLTNILIGWIIQPITVLGFIATIAGWIFLPLGMVVAWMVWLPLQYMILMIQATSMLPFASLSL